MKLAANVPDAVNLADAEEYTNQALRTVDRMSEFNAYGDTMNDADARERRISSALTDALIAGACRSGRVSFIRAA